VNDLFEWDAGKARENEEKHGVSFEEATTVFGPGKSQLGFDVEHSKDEDRFIIIGFSGRGRLLTVWHTFREPHIRIIGARLATAAERRNYEKGHSSRR
jgi:uncharacterized DUF497 family protein